MVTPDSILLVGKGVFALAGFAAGIRLARHVAHSTGFPLQAVASALIFVGGSGLLLYGFGSSAPPDLSPWLMWVGDALERVAMVGLCWFLFRVFGAGRASRVALLCGMVGILSADTALTWAQPGWPQTLPVAAQVAGQVVFALPFAWSAAESGGEALRSRRRERLGLSEPLVTNRFGLWCAGTAALAGVCLLAAVQPLVGPGVAGATRILAAGLYLVVAATVLFGLFPPAAYRRWIGAAARSSG
jgi:hypothetical protein